MGYPDLSYLENFTKLEVSLYRPEGIYHILIESGSVTVPGQKRNVPVHRLTPGGRNFNTRHQSDSLSHTVRRKGGGEHFFFQLVYKGDNLNGY